MKPWNEITHYAGIDWAKDHHDVVIVDASGKIVAEWRMAHTADAWRQWRQEVERYPGLAVAIETTHGTAVEQLLDSGATVFPVHPVNSKRYRERKNSSGNKTDKLDAWSLADALRVDGQGWRALASQDPLIVELRLLCRDEVALIEERTALVNQLQQALYEYYPAALEAFEDWTMQCAWAFVEAFPAPEVLAKAGKRRWEKFLHTHRLANPKTYQKRLECFERSAQFKGSTPVAHANRTLKKLGSLSLAS